MEQQEKIKFRHGWRRRLYYLVGVLLATCVGLAVILGLSSMKSDDNDDNDNVIRQPRSADRSVSKELLRANELLRAMDRNAQPCDDFYQYSCGNWTKARQIPTGYSRYNRFTEGWDNVQLALKKLLEIPHDSDRESNSIRKAKNMYWSCMNEEKLTKRGAEPLKALIGTLGTWPLTSHCKCSTCENLELLLARLEELNVSPLLDLSILVGEYDASKYMIWIDQASLGMKRIHFLKERNSKEVMAYEELRRQQAVHVLGLTPSSSLNNTISDIVDFEIQLAQMSASVTERRHKEKFYKEMTVSQLQTSMPQFHWKRYLSTYFRAANVNIKDNTVVAMFAENYTASMLALLKRTDNRTVANYLLMRLVGDYANHLSRKIRDLSEPLNRVLYGMKETRARWKMCVGDLDTFMPMAMGQLFVSTYFPPSAKEKMLEMISYVQEAMKEMISDTVWMDASTKTKALEKAGAMVKKIGYPDYQFNESVMENLYGDVDFRLDTYFENAVASTRSNAIVKAKKLEKTHSREDWSISASTVNAFYDPSENSITFPAGILQPPFYAEDFPVSMMFGAIGNAIGHEITHGFDDQGRKYDKEGKNQQWWSQTSIDNFKNLSSCYVDQYSKEKVAGLNIKGKLTLGENIGDNGGLKATYLGFQKWQSSNGKQEELPGLGLTHEQLFFVSFGQVWCNLFKTEDLRQSMQTDTHSPDVIRARLPAANLEAFAKAFNCSVGSVMNPEKKCTLW